MKNLFIFFGMLMITFSTLASSRSGGNLYETITYLSKDVMVKIEGREITLRAGTPIVVEMSQNYGGTNINEGQAINVRVKFGVVVEKQTVIAAGALGSALISRYEKPKSFGRQGKIEISVQSVQTVDGQNVLLSGIPLILEGENRKLLAWGLSLGLGILTGVGVVTGFFIKGKPAEVRGGTTINTNVASDMQVEVEEAKRRK